MPNAVEQSVAQWVTQVYWANLQAWALVYSLLSDEIWSRSSGHGSTCKNFYEKGSWSGTLPLLHISAPRKSDSSFNKWATAICRCFTTAGARYIWGSIWVWCRVKLFLIIHEKLWQWGCWAPHWACDFLVDIKQRVKHECQLITSHALES